MATKCTYNVLRLKIVSYCIYRAIAYLLYDVTGTQDIQYYDFITDNITVFEYAMILTFSAILELTSSILELISVYYGNTNHINTVHTVL